MHAPYARHPSGLSERRRWYPDSFCIVNSTLGYGSPVAVQVIWIYVLIVPLVGDSDMVSMKEYLSLP